MKKQKPIRRSVKTEPYFECSRCESNSDATSSRPHSVPCNKEECQAKAVGTKTVTIEVFKTKK